MTQFPTTVFLLASLLAQSEAPPRHARPSIVVEHRTLARGTTSWLALHFEIDPGWHLYWNGRNDSGLPPEVTPVLPKGFRLGAPLWPVPERLLSPGPILDHVYAERFTLLYPLELPKSAPPEATLGFKVDWLACQEMCVRESDSLVVRVSIGDQAEEQTDATLFREARAALPEKVTEAPYTLRWSADRDTVRLHLELPDPGAASGTPKVAGLVFFPDTECSEIADPGRTTLVQGRALDLALPKKKERPRLSGILEVRLADGTRHALLVTETKKK
ncbi:MAG: protein-disulfide reductase DsbD family protein [Candidatus Eisenbacteria bacterium]